jgi:hypothetical protein
VTPAAAAEEEE